MSTLPMSVSVVVPCFDEERRIGATIATLADTLRSLAPPAWEVIVVDDRSTDRTVAVVRESMSEHPEVRLVTTDVGKGKGAAVRTGAAHAVHEAVLVVDADLAGDLGSLPAMVAALADADAVLGSRLLPGAVIEPARSLRRRAAAFVFRAAVRWATPLRVSDPQCGCKLFRREPLQRQLPMLQTDGYAYEIELLVRLQHAGARLVEQPVTWREGRDSKVRVARDGAAMLRDVWKVRRRTAWSGARR